MRARAHSNSRDGKKGPDKRAATFSANELFKGFFHSPERKREKGTGQRVGFHLNKQETN